MFARLWIELPELNSTPFAKADVEVKNKMKHALLTYSMEQSPS